jgi:hypothetical protein
MDNIMNSDNDIQYIIIARDNIAKCENKDGDILTIYDLLNRYIKSCCSHKVIEDYIDIGERSIKIKYCEICFTTLL